MKSLRILSAQVLAMVLLIGTPAQAQAWTIPDRPELGHHSVVIQESVEFFRVFPLLETYEPTKTVYCSSLDDVGCSTPTYFYMNAPLAICGRMATTDCLSEFSFSRFGKSTNAEFVRYAYKDHPNAFRGDGNLIPRQIGAPSIWRASEVPHADGDLYMVIAGLQGGVELGKDRDTTIYAQVFPIREVIDPGFQPGAQSYWGHYCTFTTESSGKKIAGGCVGSGDSRCIVNSDDGICYQRSSHAEDAQITLKMKLRQEPIGWFHGRMSSPNIEIKADRANVELTLSALPVKVPTFYSGAYYSDMPNDIKRYWDRCLPRRECNASTRIANSDPWAQPDGTLRNVLSEEKPYGARAFRIISVFDREVGSRAVASPTSWAFRTLQVDRNSRMGQCTQNVEGLVGIVATNATAYEDGAPRQTGGFLDYRVAGLRYLEDGSSIHFGTYDLLMRSDLARCVYGFGKAPVSAQVQVVNESGQDVVATTTVSERGGWLKLAAYGFTFSEKKIKVRITQPQTKTLSDHPGRATALTTKQKAEIRAVLAKGKGNSKFICTGIRLEGQSESMNRTVRLRAKLACEYARSIDPTLSTFYQSKLTKARNFNGRVLVVSK